MDGTSPLICVCYADHRNDRRGANVTIGGAVTTPELLRLVSVTVISLAGALAYALIGERYLLREFAPLATQAGCSIRDSEKMATFARAQWHVGTAGSAGVLFVFGAYLASGWVLPEVAELSGLGLLLGLTPLGTAFALRLQRYPREVPSWLMWTLLAATLLTGLWFGGR